MINLREMTIGEVVRNHPESVEVLVSFGMGCVGCPSAQAETVIDACRVHGISSEELITALEKVIN